jgi:hypothetical protein
MILKSVVVFLATLVACTALTVGDYISTNDLNPQEIHRLREANAISGDWDAVTNVSFGCI